MRHRPGLSNGLGRWLPAIGPTSACLSIGNSEPVKRLPISACHAAPSLKWSSRTCKEIHIGAQGIEFDRYELNQWADNYIKTKSVEKAPLWHNSPPHSERPGETQWREKRSPPSTRGTGSGTSTRSSEVHDLKKALEQAKGKKPSSTCFCGLRNSGRRRFTAYVWRPTGNFRREERRGTSCGSEWSGKVSYRKATRPEQGMGFPYDGTGMHRMNNSAWKKARVRAAKIWPEKYLRPALPGFASIRVHDLKHTFGRRLRAAGVTLEDRKALLGHKNGSITSHYSTAELGQLIEAANKAFSTDSRGPALTILRRKTG